MSYTEYLKSNHWKRVRKEFAKTNKTRCCYLCMDFRDIVIHHASYKYHKTKGKIDKRLLNDLYYLCDIHHNEIHQLQKSRHISVEEATEQIFAQCGYTLRTEPIKEKRNTYEGLYIQKDSFKERKKKNIKTVKIKFKKIPQMGGMQIKRQRQNTEFIVRPKEDVRCRSWFPK